VLSSAENSRTDSEHSIEMLLSHKSQSLGTQNVPRMDQCVDLGTLMVLLKESLVLVIGIWGLRAHDPTHDLLEVFWIELAQAEKIDGILEEI
jgi:hypothetical protein